MELQFVEAFRKPDPGKVWKLVQDILRLTRSLVQESAEARFQTNFGSVKCQSCDGLKAGPNVVATCFQLKKCFYRNVRSVDISRKQLVVVDNLGVEKHPKGS